MKKFKERMAEKAGFTLVELIVVIAILGILAGIAVPAYTGYIKKANDAAVSTELSGVLTAAEAANATNVKQVSQISITETGVVTVTLKDSGTLATNYYQTFALLHGNATAANSNVTITGLDKKMADSVSFTGGATWYAEAVTSGDAAAQHPAGWVGIEKTSG